MNTPARHVIFGTGAIGLAIFDALRHADEACAVRLRGGQDRSLQSREYR